MSNVSRVGPAADAAWRLLDTGDDRMPVVAAVSDATADVTYVLPQQPSIVSDEANRPVLSVRLLLRRQPTADEETVAPLIEGGAVSIDSSLSVPNTLLDDLACDEGGEFRSLFAREARFRLQVVDTTDAPEERTETPEAETIGASSNAATGRGDSSDSATGGDAPRVLAEATASGANPRAALSATLGREDALAVLGAFEGSDESLELVVDVSYRVAAAGELSLRGSWAAIHDFYAARTDGSASREQLQQWFAELVDSAVIEVELDGEPAPASSLESAFEAFLEQSFVIFRRESETDGTSYALRDRPEPMFRLNYREQQQGSTERTRRVSAPVSDVLEGVMEHRSLDDFVSFVALDPVEGVEPTPHRRRDNSTRYRRRYEKTPTRLAVRDGEVRSLALELNDKHTATVMPQGVHADPSVKLLADGDQRLWALDDLVFVPDETRKRRLPVVDDSGAALWPDNFDSRRRWYAPAFELVQPASGTSVDESPFKFTFERTGVTETGEPALEGRVHFELQQGPSPAASQALAADGRTGRPVTLQDVTVSLAVPFVDSSSGETRSHRFNAEVSNEGDRLVATVPLLNNWVRLCYGALAVEGFQSERASVTVEYTFPAYVRVPEERHTLTYGAKTATASVVYSSHAVERGETSAVVDASTATLHLPGRTLRLDRDGHVSRESRALLTAADALTVDRPNLATNLGTSIPVSVLARPTITTVSLPEPTTLQERTLVRDVERELFVSCSAFGQLYVEQKSTGSEAIGCQDALQLGALDAYLQYERLDEFPGEDDELADHVTAVYKSVTQPGSFLVVPARYRITRYAVDTPDAYQPVAAVYSLIDLEANTQRLVFDAELRPDLSPAVIHALRESLLAYHPSPHLRFPTDVMSAAEYSWAGDFEPSVLEGANRLRVTTESEFATEGLVMLRRLASHLGISGYAQFQLSDGVVLPTVELALQLCRLTGPWEVGPVEVTPLGEAIRLTNHSRERVGVSELRVYTGDQRTATISVDASLDPDASETIATSNSPAGTDIVAVFAEETCTTRHVDETRVFIGETPDYVEDIDTTVFLFFPQMDYAGAGVAELEARARFVGDEGSFPFVLTGEPPVGTVTATYPLTAYLGEESSQFQFQVTVVTDTGERRDSAWFDWDVHTSGVLIDVPEAVVLSTATERFSPETDSDPEPTSSEAGAREASQPPGTMSRRVNEQQPQR